MSDDVLTRNENDELAVRVVSATESSTVVNPDDVYTRDTNGNLAVRTVGAGGGDQHNLGYFATLQALQEAYPTAEAGDWAIVGATDTVWIWDTDTSAWVDSDTKGQVTSVNNQTGAVTISADDILPTQTGNSGRVLGTDGFVAGWIEPEIVQRDTMPQADENEVGNIYQFVGTTTGSYTNGYFYKCVSDGGNPATYSWTQVNVQPAPVIPDPLPSQTGNAGKFLTTNGTEASWETISALQNIATNSTSVYITDRNASTVSQVPSAVVLGQVGGAGYPNAVSEGSVIIGCGAYSLFANYSIAIGVGAVTRGVYAIQLGSGTNSDANTFKVGNNNGNFELMSADGTIPKERLANVVTTPSTMPTLAVADWSSNTQTVNVTGVTATNTVFVSPAPASAADYASAGIVCTAQGAGTLTFTCTTVPSNAITVNVVCL